MVPEEGVEPTRPCDQRILSPEHHYPSVMSVKDLQQVSFSESGHRRPFVSVRTRRLAISRL